MTSLNFSKEKISIIGAGGHTRSLIPLLKTAGYDVAGIYDDNFHDGETIFDCPLLGKLENVPKGAQVVISSGKLKTMRKFHDQFAGQVLEKNIVHASAIIDESVSMGTSNQVFAGVFINAMAKIGSHNILNTRCIVEHEAMVDDHCHISVGSIICGRSKIGNRCYLGAGAIIIDDVSVCDDVIIGAGTVVVRNIEESGTYVGNPVRKIK